MAPYMVRCKVQKTSPATLSENVGAWIEGIFPTHSVAWVGALGFRPGKQEAPRGVRAGLRGEARSVTSGHSAGLNEIG
jgi:hypothetical protein